MMHFLAGTRGGSMSQECPELSPNCSKDCGEGCEPKCLQSHMAAVNSSDVPSD